MKIKIFGGIALMAIAAAVAFNVSLNLNKSNNQLSQLALANVEALASEGGGSNWICSTYTSKVEDEYTEDCYDSNNQRVRKISERYATRVCNSGWLSSCYPGFIFTSYDCDGIEKKTDNTESSSCS